MRRPSHTAQRLHQDASAAPTGAPRCTADPEHVLPPDANFCVQCGVPVRQACPWDPDHMVNIVDGERRAPASCPRCHRLLRACDRCGRLHKLEATECLTGACDHRSLPRPRLDWNAWAGGLERSGAAPWEGAIPDSPAEWTNISLNEPGAAFISAYGYPFLAAGTTLRRHEATSPFSDMETLRLPEPLLAVPGSRPAQAERGVLLANHALLFVLTEGGCFLADPAPLLKRDFIPGLFTHQITHGRRLLLWGESDATGEDGLHAVELDAADLRPVLIPQPDPAPPVLPPVWNDSRIYWVTDSARLLEYDGDTVKEWGPPPGTDAQKPLALIAGVPNADTAGLYLLTQSARNEATLSRFQRELNSNGMNWVTTSVAGSSLLPRMWATPDHLFLARYSVSPNASEGPAWLQINPRALGQQPEERAILRSAEIMAALPLYNPSGTNVALLLRDPTQNAAGLYLLREDDRPPQSLRREVGPTQGELFYHDGWVFVLFTTPQGQTMKGFRL